MHVPASRQRGRRRGAIAVLVAVLLIFLMALVAFSVDIGFIALVKNQLQVAAEAAAHTAATELGNGQATARTKARDIARANIAGGPKDYVTLSDEDVIFGNWNTTTRSFTAGGNPANAVKVVAQRSLPLFFAPVLGVPSMDVRAEAIAMVNPRDIAFVIDLSGSMNNDSEIWATAAINSQFPGYPTVGTDLMAAIFQDFDFGSFPGVFKHIGENPGQGTGLAPAYLSSSELVADAYTNLVRTSGTGTKPLLHPSLASTYRIAAGDSNTTKKTKAYRWIIDYQLKQLMPNARPAPDSATHFAYWSDYLDYVIKPNANGTPPNQTISPRIATGSNPYADAWPDLSGTSSSQFYNKLGYQTYVQFMMDQGRNEKVANGQQYTPLSQYSPDCPFRTETNPSSAAYGMTFPPREQPTHAARVAIIAAIKKIASLNVGIAGTLNDHVAVISFDTASGTTIQHPLNLTSCDYTAACNACRLLQAVGDGVNSTASENGLIKARDHLDHEVNPTQARSYANKMILFLSDGIPNIKQSSNTTINNFLGNNTGEWFASGSFVNERNAVLMQVAQMKQKGWKTFLIGVGLGADRDLMDRAARMAGTAIADPNNPNGPKISPYADGNPADYEHRLTSIFDEIVSSKSVSIVQ